jgi:hypothetical protein
MGDAERAGGGVARGLGASRRRAADGAKAEAQTYRFMND